jgi:hypothetical protein
MTMKVVSEKELVKLQAKGGKALDPRGKVIIPRLSEAPAKDPAEEKPEDPIAGAVEVMKQCLQEISAGSRNTSKVMVMLAQCMEKVVALQQADPALLSDPSPHSWRFEVRRNADGFIQEITACPTKGDASQPIKEQK